MNTKDNLFVAVVGYNSNDCTVSINDTRYIYRINRMSGFRVAQTVEGIAKHSPGKAIKWLKENAEVIGKYGPNV